MTRIDEALLRRHLDRAIHDHDQAFEEFFLARLLDLSFAYLPDAAKPKPPNLSRDNVAGAGTTIEMKVQFMRPASEGTLTAEGRFTRRGRRIAFMESHVRNESDDLIAHATATYSIPPV